MIKKILKKILTWPINLIKKIFFKKRKKSRIEELNAYLDLAYRHQLKVDAQVNYNNELIVNMSNFEKESKRVRKKEKSINDQDIY